jgi:hypothetical protein
VRSILAWLIRPRARFVRHLLAAVGASLVVMLGLVSVALAAPTASTPTLASITDPFAACTFGGPGTNFPNAEVEPFIAVDPTNSSRLIGAFQQDRWSDGGAHGLLSVLGRRWVDVGQLVCAAEPVRGRQRCQRRQLSALLRPVGECRTRRTRVPGQHLVCCR